MSVLARLRRGMATFASGTRELLESAFVAIVLMPVLPDIAVDSLGGGSVADGWLRILALLFVLALCLVVYWWRLRRARHRLPDAAVRRLRPYRVVVLPASHNYTYTPRDRRTDTPTIAERIVDEAKPELVLIVVTLSVEGVIDKLKEGLADDDIDSLAIHLDDPGDYVEKAVPVTVDRVLAALSERGVEAREVCFDVTGGNVPMSLAMLRAAVMFGSECCYVTREWTPAGPAKKLSSPSAFHPESFVGVSSE